MEILDDLVVLGADADIPRPEGQPASNYVPADLFPSVLMVGGLCLCCAHEVNEAAVACGHEHTHSYTPNKCNAYAQVWNTLQLCGPQILRLTPFPLGWLEQALAATTKGLIPDLLQEVVHRLLATILNDRKDQVGASAYVGLGWARRGCRRQCDFLPCPTWLLLVLPRPPCY